jgi:hypothetical protein
MYPFSKGRISDYQGEEQLLQVELRARGLDHSGIQRMKDVQHFEMPG